MMSIYYKIWADAILSFRKYHPTKNWEAALFVHITWMHALNWWIVFIWIKYFDILTIPLININFLPGTILDKVLAFIIEFALPFATLNYFLIFYKKRYKKIIEKYSTTLKFRYAPIYSLIVILGAFIWVGTYIKERFLYQVNFRGFNKMIEDYGATFLRR